MMRRVSVALFAALLAAAPAFAADKDDVMASVKQFVDGFNKGDVKSALAACAEQTSIVDEFPPHEWHGPGACAAWANDFDADAKKNGITDGKVTLGKPRHVDVAGDRAYVVVPASYAYKLKGKPTKETGSMLTIALQKGASGWRMTGWAWTKG
ncbi:MAG TPA: nuclear transport factor 2 family protein [Casimicrobiaceae bacterium]|nr:nuclear transport factor 2 family protein [Casimicrobiaceae bacterium]